MKTEETKKRDKNGTRTEKPGQKRDKNNLLIQPQNSFPKTDFRHWTAKVKKRSDDGTYQTRLRIEGRDVWIDTHCGNREDAARKAKEIYFHARSNGIASTIAEYKREADKQDPEALHTVGDLFRAIRSLDSPAIKSKTLEDYIGCYRTIAAEIAIPERRRKELEPLKFDYRTGGREKWIEATETVRLDRITIDEIAKWRKGKTPATAASQIRQAKALFSTRIIPAETSEQIRFRAAFLAKIPAEATLKDVRPHTPRATKHRTIAKATGTDLIALARTELKEKDPEAFKAILLTFYAGMRRREIDLVLWESVNPSEATIRVEPNPYFRPKSESGHREIDLPASIMEELRRTGDNTGKFVIGSGKRWPKRLEKQHRGYLRCAAMWDRLSKWLRSKGVAGSKTAHYLRKEAGSHIATEFGIEAARQFLGHADIGTTSNFYSDKKAKHTITAGLPAQPAKKEAKK